MSRVIAAKTWNLETVATPDALNDTRPASSPVSHDILQPGQHDFRMLLEAVSDYAVYMLSPQGIVSSWNKGAERNKGYSSAEAIGLHVSSFYTQEDRATGEPAKALQAASASKFETYGWRVRKDGSRFWAHVVLEAIRDEQGTIVGFAKVTCDVTAQKIDRDLLVRNLDAALSNMSQGLCMFDAEERLVLSNSQAEKILGLAPGDLAVGATLLEILGSIVGENNKKSRAKAMALYDKHSVLIRQPGGGSLVVQKDIDTSLSVVHRPMADGSWVTTIEDVSERSRSQKQLAHMALHDALTDLPNRILFRQKLEDAIHQVQWGLKCAILCLDLDRFKNVNDTLGHPAGDALLVSIANRLRKIVRKNETVARLGGDEFAIIQTNVRRSADTIDLAERVLIAISQPVEVTGHLIACGVSIGIALAPKHGIDPDHLLKCADVALYRAKANGRGRYCHFEKEMDTQLETRLLMEVDLRAALATQAFELFCQPILDIASNKVCSFEALLRWHSPSRGVVSPVDFIPVAEEIGLIVDIGNWVLEQACYEAVRWPDHVRVAVNVSVAQFKDFALVDSVNSALSRSGLSANRLEIEITESIMIRDSKHTCEVLYRLKHLGVSISMDDFGTGYSSLGYLRSFPFDKIKIDRSFIQGLGDADDCKAIVQAVMGICDSLGIIATAEGVETEDQMILLRSRSCHQAQGYLISKPRPASAITEMLQAVSRSI